LVVTATTTIRVSVAVRDEVRRLAAANGLTIDEQLRRMARLERQIKMAIDNSTRALTAEDLQVLEAGRATVREHLGR
jgi:cytidylate kinase